MSTVNKQILLGRLGQDPGELRYTQNGTAVCNLSIATNSGYGDNETTEWHEVVVWGKAAEQCAQYLQKGRQVYLEGETRTDVWTDRENNERKTKKVHANYVTFIPDGQGSGGSNRGGRGGNGGGSGRGGNGGGNRGNGGGNRNGGGGGGWGNNNESGGQQGGNSGGGWGKNQGGGGGNGWGNGGGWGKKNEQKPDQGNGGSGGRDSDDDFPF